MTDTSGFSDRIPTKLRNLYQIALDKSLNTPFQHDTDCSAPTNPFIPNADARYWDAKVKVMIFGQETRGWLTETPFPECIDAATIADQYTTGMASGVPRWKGAFRNGFNKLKSQLEQHYEVTNKSVGFAWNNLIKIGKNGSGTPCNCIIKWQQHWFDVTKKEVEDFYRPDIILFLTGPSYDGYIKSIFPDIKRDSVEGYEKKQMARLSSSSFSQATAIRTYHPAYLFRDKSRADQYFGYLVNLLLDQAANQ